MIAKGGSRGHIKWRSDCGVSRVSDSVSDAASDAAQPRRLEAGRRGRKFRVAVVVCGLALLAGAGCATRQRGFAQRLVKPGTPKLTLDDRAAAPTRDAKRVAPRRLKAAHAAATSKTSLLPTVETTNPELARALLELSLVASAAHHRAVAAAYRRAGVSDYAFRHYERALQLDGCDSAALEGTAQIWRDWGMPDRALGAAYRAVYCGPDSASAHNTLGTVFQALGQTALARQSFERANELDVHAAMPLNNLCYLALEAGSGRDAQRFCERALAEEPGLAVARYNLTYALVMQGDEAAAERRLLDRADHAAGLHAVGMLRMTLGEYATAADAFEAAARERPSSLEFRRRAVQARKKARAHEEP
jgi:Flp pilus assembly protein TadD